MLHYEDGMAVFYDTVTKGVFVDFRGQFIYLSGPYLTRSSGLAAGEEKCRELGWIDSQTIAA